MSVSPLSGLAGLSSGRPPDPELAQLVVRRLRCARGSALEVTARLRVPLVGWQGPAADALVRDLAVQADAVLRWAERAERLITSVVTLVADLEAELARRAQVRLAVLDALGRLAILPADIHRDIDRELARLSGGGWDAALTTLRSFLP